jgi:hypothetical protein
MDLKIILRLARRHLPWMASLLKAIYYTLRLVSEAVNYRVKHIYSQVPAVQRQPSVRSHRSHTDIRQRYLPTSLAPLDAAILLLSLSLGRARCGITPAPERHMVLED